MFYKSKKFAYAVTMLIASVAVALLPAALNLDAAQTSTLNEIVPLIIVFGYLLIGGHSVMDALSMAKGAQVPSVSDAVDDVIDAIENP